MTLMISSYGTIYRTQVPPDALALDLSSFYIRVQKRSHSSAYTVAMEVESLS
jgi:hypothetical protein